MSVRPSVNHYVTVLRLTKFQYLKRSANNFNLKNDWVILSYTLKFLDFIAFMNVVILVLFMKYINKFLLVTGKLEKKVYAVTTRMIPFNNGVACINLLNNWTVRKLALTI